MIDKKFILSLKSSFLITIFSLFVFTACSDGCKSAPKLPRGKGSNSTAKGTTGKKGTAGNTEKESSKKTNTKPTPTPSNLQKTIVLFHGLGVPEDTGISALGKKLKNDIKDVRVMILKRPNSTTVSTTQQAEEAYATLKEELKKKDMIGSPICLIGDSHGGLVALELYRQYKDDLNIVGIVTNHSPLEGAPGVNVDIDVVNEFKKTVRGLLTSASLFLGGLTLNPSQIDSLPLKEMLTGGIQQPLIDDLTANSSLLNNIRATLTSIQIPVLVLAGYADILTNIDALLGFASQDKRFGQELSKVREQLKELQKEKDKMEEPLKLLINGALSSLEDTFGRIIGDKRNDSFLPYYSQYAEHISVSPSVMRNPKQGYHHFYGMQYHNEVYNDIVRFVNQAFENKK